MDSLAQAVQAADGPWPVLAIAIIGVYVLVWKFGSQILDLAKAAHQETKSISESIVTNHGSKNLGDAIDRLYEMQLVQTEILSGLDDRIVKLEEKGDG